MPDDTYQNFKVSQSVTKPEQRPLSTEISSEEYLRRVAEWKEKLSSERSWRGRELRRRMAHRF